LFEKAVESPVTVKKDAGKTKKMVLELQYRSLERCWREFPLSDRSMEVLSEVFSAMGRWNKVVARDKSRPCMSNAAHRGGIFVFKMLSETGAEKLSGSCPWYSSFHSFI